MQRLSSIDAITPAFTRTHEILFKPFRLGRSWKLAASQYVAFLGAFFAPFPLAFAFIPASGKERMAFVLVGLAMTLVLLAFFYVGVRMQFVCFEMVVTRGQFVAPMWRRYGRVTWSVIGFKTLLGTVLIALLGPLFWLTLKPYFLQFVKLQSLTPTTPGQPPDFAQIQAFFSAMFIFYGFVILGIMVIKLFTTMFEDFAMPFMALEGMPVVAAIAAGWRVISADPLQVALYLFMKMVLFIVGAIMQYFANLVFMIPFLIVLFVGIAIVAAAGGGHGGPGGTLLAGAGIFTACFIFVVAVTGFSIGSYGYLNMLLEAYAIYFLGSRYARLGDLLEPPVAPYVYAPPPVFPSREEAKDGDEDGPSLPMNPALA